MSRPGGPGASSSSAAARPAPARAPARARPPPPARVAAPPPLIAPAPPAPDPTTYADALGVLRRLDLIGRTPPAVLALLERGRAGAAPETPKALPDRVRNV